MFASILCYREQDRTARPSSSYYCPVPSCPGQRPPPLPPPPSPPRPPPSSATVSASTSASASMSVSVSVSRGHMGLRTFRYGAVRASTYTSTDGRNTFQSRGRYGTVEVGMVWYGMVWNPPIHPPGLPIHLPTHLPCCPGRLHPPSRCAPSPRTPPPRTDTRGSGDCTAHTRDRSG